MVALPQGCDGVTPNLVISAWGARISRVPPVTPFSITFKGVDGIPPRRPVYASWPAEDTIMIRTDISLDLYLESCKRLGEFKLFLAKL